MKNKKTLIAAGVSLAAFIIFTILLKVVDVQSIGPDGSWIGFASLNDGFRGLFGVSDFWYRITELLGYLSIALAGAYAIYGFVQLCKVKSLKKVNPALLAYGGLLVVTVILYILFDKFVINYRPLILEGELEPSYPSSHTMISLCISGGAVLLNDIIFAGKKYTKVVNVIISMLAAVIVCGRMFSGVHWFTDIIGGLLISAFLVFGYSAVLEKITSSKERKKVN